VGGVAVADTVSPYIVRLSLSEADTIRVTGETQLASEPNTAFFRVLTLTGQSPPEHVVVADRFHKRSSIETRALWKLTDTLDVAWKTDVTPSGATDPGVLDLVLHDGNVLACGSAGVEKDGGRWSAGLLASVSVDGQRNWARGIARSEKGDYFTRFFSSAGSWYVVGEFSGFVHGPTDGRYGLAGIFQVDMSSGAVLEAWTFGSADYASFFSGGIAVGTRVFCGGATNFKVSDSYHQGWLVEVDLGAPDPSGPPVLPSFPDAVSGWRHPLVPGR